MSGSIPSKMQAAVLHGYNDLRFQEFPVPEPGSLEVLLKIHAVAICGTDPTVISKGWTGMPAFGFFIPGHEYSGEVVALGLNVSQFKVGDRVAIETHKGCGHCMNCKRGKYTICLNYGKPETGHRHYGFTTNGGYAQYTVNHISTLYRIPDNVSYDEAALVTTSACAHFALDNIGGLMGGEKVAVLGPGPMGLMALQLVKALGASTTILTGTRDDRLEVGKKLGADRTVNINNEDAVQVVKDFTNGMGVDLVVECSGSSDAVAQAIDMAARGGRLSLIGDPHGLTTVNLRRFVLDDMRASGVRGEGNGDCARSLSLISDGKVLCKPLITHHFPLEKINEGIDTFVHRKGGALKVIIQPNL